MFKDQGSGIKDQGSGFSVPGSGFQGSVNGAGGTDKPCLVREESRQKAQYQRVPRKPPVAYSLIRDGLAACRSCGSKLAFPPEGIFLLAELARLFMNPKGW